MNVDKNIASDAIPFEQAFLDIGKNKLLTVLDSCYKIISGNDSQTVHERILSESLRIMRADKGFFFIIKDSKEPFEIIDYLGSNEAELKRWSSISLFVKDELQINSKVFYEIQEDRKVDLNSLIIPVHYKDKLYGFLKLAQRQGLGKFSKLDLSLANELIDFINVAITKHEDAETAEQGSLGLYGRRAFRANYFTEYLANELRRAHRYKKAFSLIDLEIDNFDSIKKKFSGKTINNFIIGLLERLNEIIRETDFITEEAEAKYLIMLPETDYFGSLITVRKINSILSQGLTIKDDNFSAPVSLMISSATYLKDGETGEEILRNLKARTKNAKSSIATKLDIKKKPFIEILKALTDGGQLAEVLAPDKKGYDKLSLQETLQDEKGTTRFASFPSLMINQVENIILNEAWINPERGGIIFIGKPSLEDTLAMLKNLPNIKKAKSRLFLITKQCEKEIVYPNITYIFTADVTIKDYYFIVYLNEEYAYGLFAKKGMGDTYKGFHTSDSFFIENLVVKLQNQYLLQEKL